MQKQQRTSYIAQHTSSPHIFSAIACCWALFLSDVPATCQQCVVEHKQADEPSQEQLPQADKLAVEVDATSAALIANDVGSGMHHCFMHITRVLLSLPASTAAP